MSAVQYLATGITAQVWGQSIGSGQGLGSGTKQALRIHVSECCRLRSVDVFGEGPFTGQVAAGNLTGQKGVAQFGGIFGTGRPHR